MHLDAKRGVAIPLHYEAMAPNAEGALSRAF